MTFIPTNPDSPPCCVSVVIKALNEEMHIAQAIETSLAAIQVVGGEVILADSCSTDGTVHIARRYPITIAQLANPAERCCGIGPQLGYQHSRGEFIYILDGDMQLDPHFLPAALEIMRSRPDIAGVGGRVEELNTTSLEFVIRTERAAATAHMQAGEVDRLEGGGLYRRQAIEQVGYLSNRNLHSYEEYDLAARLRTSGWRLWRLDMTAVSHYGHETPAYQLLIRRWKTRYICGLGELIRAALRGKHLPMLLCEIRELRIYLATLAWWFAILITAALPLPRISRIILELAITTIPLLLMAAKKRSIGKAIYSVISWNFNAAGLCRGLFAAQTNPHAAIDSVFPAHRG